MRKLLLFFLILLIPTLYPQKPFGSTLDDDLFSAIKNNKLEKVKALVRKGANFQKKNKYGDSYLDECAYVGYIDIVKYFVEEVGFSVYMKNNDGRTPLFHAADGGHVNVVQYLVEKGAKVNQKDSIGVTPIFLAAAKGHLKVIEFLVQKGAAVNIKEYRGYTPLHLAVNYRHLDVIKVLVENGADISSKSQSGKTPLDMADGGIKKYLESHLNTKVNTE